MSPFEEATPEQLGRLLTIIDHYEDNIHGPSLSFLLNWANGGEVNRFTTEAVIFYWEHRQSQTLPDM
jgi:hypothetical protein